jgi:hypothetical protein
VLDIDKTSAPNFNPKFQVAHQGTTLLDVSGEEEKSISLDAVDWSEFLQDATDLLQIAVDVSDGDETNKIIGIVEALSGNFQLLAVTFYNTVTFTLKSNERTLYFCTKDIETLLKIKQLVDHRLDLLKKLDFRSFYDQLLNYINTVDIQNAEFFDIVKNMCTLNVCEQSYLILELIECYPNKMLSDFDKLSINL